MNNTIEKLKNFESDLIGEVEALRKRNKELEDENEYLHFRIKEYRDGVSSGSR